MWSRTRLLLTDPRMITVWVFTVFLIVVFSVVSARPWNDTDLAETTNNLQECEYFQANGQDILKYDIDDIAIKKCVDKIWQKLQEQERKSKKQRRRRKGRKKSKNGRKGRKGRKKGRKGRKKKNRRKNRRPDIKGERVKTAALRQGDGVHGGGGGGDRRQRLKRQRKMFLEQEEFRKWKRKISVANLMAEPVAQEAIGDLWTDLIARGDQWKEIYEDMHQNQDPHHIAHHNKPVDRDQITESPASSITSSISSSTTILSSTTELP